MFLEYY